MKILQIITSLNTGGAEKLLVEMLPIFQFKDVQTDVVVLNDKSTPFRRILENRFRGSIWYLTKGSVYNPLLIFKIIPFLRKYKLVHVHLFPALYWVVLAKWISFSKVSIIYTEHNTSNKRRDNLVLKHIDRIIYKGVKHLVTISEDVDFNLKKHLKRSNNAILKIENGINVSEFSNASPYEKSDFFSNDPFLLIQVSSFREQKDQTTLIKSLLYLPENVKLLLVGDGPLRMAHEQLVEDLNLHHRVVFLGIRTDVARLLKTADVVVLSSHYEGLSLSSIEGMAANPFVASDVPGLREIVQGFGLIFEQGNPQDLAQKILSLYENEDVYAKIADSCHKRARDFDINKTVEKYIELYKSS